MCEYGPWGVDTCRLRGRFGSGSKEALNQPEDTMRNSTSWTVWGETTNSHSTWIMARCTNHNAADAVAEALRESGIITLVQAPERIY
jgi:hypothetical protein